MTRLALMTIALVVSLMAAEPPATMLWVWESPTDLRSAVIPGQWGVAFLLGEVHLEGKSTDIRPRAQPLRITAGTYRMGVIRIHQASDPKMLSKLLAPILAIADRTRVDALQIDYDAPSAALADYRTLLASLRAARPGLFLSITALLGHCPAPSWLAGAPVDETVVMFFRLGSLTAANRLIASDAWRTPACQSSVGFSLDEPRPILTPEVRWKRVYIFPGLEGWSRKSLEKLQRVGNK